MLVCNPRSAVHSRALRASAFPDGIACNIIDQVRMLDILVARAGLYDQSLLVLA